MTNDGWLMTDDNDWWQWLIIMTNENNWGLHNDWWQLLMTITDDNVWWQWQMTITDDIDWWWW